MDSGGLSSLRMSSTSSRERDLRFERHGKTGGRRLAFDGDAVNHALPDGLFTDGILGDLRHGQRDGAREQRLVGFNFHRSHVQIRRAEIQREPRFAGIFVPLGDGDRLQFDWRRLDIGGMDAGAGEWNRLRTLVVNREPQPAPRAGGK